MMKIGIVGEVHEDGLKILQNENFDIIQVKEFSKNNLIHSLSDVDAIILRTSNLDSEILSSCPKLKIVSRHGVGYDNVDQKYLQNNNIALSITSTSNAASVAEHVITMFLVLSKNIFESNKIVKSGNYKLKSQLPNFFELYKKNIFILGFGRIGKALAKRCLGFEANISVYDPFVSKSDIENYGCTSVNKEEGFRNADYISIHMPLNKETKNLISYDEFKIFKKNLILVNTARGGIINEAALYKALSSKSIFGAGLDVYEVEPPPSDLDLFKLDNIILSPHNAALTLECRKRMAIECCENVYHFLKDKEKLNPNNIIDLSK